MSSTTTSGSVRRPASSACSPSLATATTSKSRDSSAEIDSRING
jgi:hypothetical protein